MNIVTPIGRQVVDLKGANRSLLLKKLRELVPSKYELIVERSGKLIRYSSDTVAVVHYEIWYKAVSITGVGDKFAVNYKFVDPKGGLQIRIALFEGGVCTLDLAESDFPEIKKKDVEVLYVGSQEKGVDLSKCLNTDHVDQVGLSTSNSFQKLTKHRFKLALALASAVIAYGVFSLNAFLNRPEVIVVQEQNIVTVDPYESYKGYMASSQFVRGSADALRFAWVIAHHLPQGWDVSDFKLTGSGFAAPISHNSGSFFAFDRWLTEQDGLSKYVARDGQVASVYVPITDEGVGNLYKEKIVNLPQVRDGILEMAQIMGGKVRTKQASVVENYSRQEMEITFENVGILSAIELLEKLDELPVVLKDVSATMKGNSAQSRATLVLEVVGNVS
ncbi:hypothetical protein [Vibrio owensii]|uniref:hypothetical protein n=1 Tax=Vibrio owensii TaxID=696485 RepID=UPI0018F1E3AD|nr:hypothetical protein [Vibrio owensii]